MTMDRTTLQAKIEERKGQMDAAQKELAQIQERGNNLAQFLQRLQGALAQAQEILGELDKAETPKT